MKRRALILFLLCALLLTACAVSEVEPSQTGFVFYFPAQSAAGGAVFVTLAVDDETASLPLSELLNRYFTAQPPTDARSVADNWTLRSARLDGTSCVLQFGGQSVSSSERSLFCACIARTLFQLDGILRVSIQTPGVAAPLTLTAADILTQDTGMFPQEEQMVLYYPDGDGRYLLRRTTTVEASDPADKPAAIVEALLANELADYLPDGTSLLGIGVENGVCTVDLSAALTKKEYTFAEARMVLYSLVDSLTELSEIGTVDFWVAGAPLERLGRMDISGGMQRDETILYGASDPALTDQTLYLPCGEDGKLVALPVRLAVADAAALPESVLQALFAQGESCGVKNPIPSGTKLLSARMDSTSCIVDLTAEFSENCADSAQEQAAVRAIVATLCALDGVSSVEILVEGIEPTYHSKQNSRIRQPLADWFAE